MRKDYIRLRKGIAVKFQAPTLCSAKHSWKKIDNNKFFCDICKAKKIILSKRIEFYDSENVLYLRLKKC